LATTTYKKIHDFEMVCKMSDGSMGLILVPAYEIITDGYPEWLVNRGDIFVVHKDFNGKYWSVSHKDTGAGMSSGTSRKSAVDNFIYRINKLRESQLNRGIASVKKQSQGATRITYVPKFES